MHEMNLYEFLWQWTFFALFVTGAGMILYVAGFVQGNMLLWPGALTALLLYVFDAFYGEEYEVEREEKDERLHARLWEWLVVGLVLAGVSCVLLVFEKEPQSTWLSYMAIYICVAAHLGEVLEKYRPDPV